MSACDLCGQEPAECHCYIHELEERISALEDGLDALTDVVNIMSEVLKKGMK